MVKVDRSIRRGSAIAFTRVRCLFAALLALFGCVALAVENSANQADSGWAIAAPSPLAKGVAVDPQQQLFLRHVLEYSQPQQQQSQPADQPANEPARTGLRFAVRPDGADGWRPAGQQAAPGSEIPSVQLAATRASGPTATPAQNTTAEADCGADGGRINQGTTQPNTAPLEEYSAPNSGIDEESDCNGSVEPPANNPPVAAGTQNAEDDITPEDSPAAAGDEAPGATAPQPGATVRPPSDGTPRQALLALNDNTSPPPPLTKQLTNLRNRVRAVLKGYYRKALNSKDNDPWETMHGMLAYGVHSRIHDGSARGQLITSVGWLCYNKPCKGQTLLYVTPAGELRAKYGVGLQGHLGQLLAMLAQCRVSPDYPIHVGSHEFTIHDLIEAEKKTCYPKSELTFKLIALQHYADLNDTWVNDQGVEWDFSKLVSEELAQPIRGAACGGTHRLSGLSLAVKTRIRRGEPLDGEYERAAEFVKKYQQYAFRLQNRDGSLSTAWFRGSGDEDDINRRIKTTGHILEWLCYSLSDEELREQRTIRAVTYLANLMYSNYDNEWEVGPMCHATHALLLYDERVFVPFDKPGEVASYRPIPSIAARSQQNTIKR
jgi:hypothetical protein